MQSYGSAKVIKAALSRRVDTASAKLNQYPRGAMGITPDAVRAAAEWQANKAEFIVAFKALRAFNAEFCKMFDAEIRAERNARYAELEARAQSKA